MRELCEKLEFPPEAIEALEKNKMSFDCRALYNKFISGAHEEALEEIKLLGEENGISEYMAYMIFLLECVPYAKKIFDEKKLDENIFYDTMKDLKYKLCECKQLYGSWGTFVAWWFTRHMKADLIALGRLQFEQVSFEYDYDTVLKKGDLIINCHIPSSGALTPEEVTDSLKRAYEFYNASGSMYVMCDSWLLYPPYYKLFGKNTKAFFERFDIVKVCETDIELWRIFDKNNFSEIKEDDLKTTLQKNFYKYLKNGGKTGNGVGVMKYNSI